MRHVLVLDAGGTISSAPAANGALDGGRGLVGALGVQAADLRIRPVYAGLSEEMSLAQAGEIVAAALTAAATPQVAGIVVAHGTDTMEETAFLADLHWTSRKPLVFTGAQRSPDQPDFDGLDNLRDALAIAESPQADGLGAWIVFGGRVLPARGAFKRHTAALTGFAHRMGRGVALGQPLPNFPRPAPLPAGPCEENVDLIGLGLGVGGRLIDAAVAGGCRGLVLEGLGRGNAGPMVAQAVRRAIAAGVVVAVASRCAEGGVSPDYASGRRLADEGAVFCDELGPSQARILLARMLALHETPEPAIAAIRNWLAAAHPTAQPVRAVVPT
jgi:L-asparaginase